MTTRLREAAGWVGQVLTWSAVFATTAVLLAAVVVPRVAGATPYTVLTGSMSPTYPPGSLVVVRPVDPASVGTGTVITFQRESGRAEVVTHRVTAVGMTTAGQLRWTTRGDANGAEDATAVQPEQLRGAVWYALPWLGHVNNAVTGRTRALLVQAASLGLAAYAAWALASAAFDRRRVTRPVRPRGGARRATT